MEGYNKVQNTCKHAEMHDKECIATQVHELFILAITCDIRASFRGVGNISPPSLGILL